VGLSNMEIKHQIAQKEGRTLSICVNISYSRRDLLGIFAYVTSQNFIWKSTLEILQLIA
jgi:hypothetical protein